MVTLQISFRIAVKSIVQLLNKWVQHYNTWTFQVGCLKYPLRNQVDTFTLSNWEIPESGRRRSRVGGAGGAGSRVLKNNFTPNLSLCFPISFLFIF